MKKDVHIAVTVLAALIAGCSPAPTATAGTGAETAVHAYYDALLKKDWPRAYAALHADSRQEHDADAFGRLAENYLKAIGFEPKEFRIRSCEEHGNEAVAHVSWVGSGNNKQRSYKDAVKLMRSGTQWLVVLPPNFGSGKEKGK